MSPIDIDQVVAWVMDEIGVLVNQIKLVVHKADFTSILTLISLVVSVVEQAAEKYKGLTGEQKKEIAQRVLNNLVDIPIVPETMEGMVFGMLIDWIVDFLSVNGWTAIDTAGKQAEAATV